MTPRVENCSRCSRLNHSYWVDARGAHHFRCRCGERWSRDAARASALDELPPAWDPSDWPDEVTEPCFSVPLPPDLDLKIVDDTPPEPCMSSGYARLLDDGDGGGEVLAEAPLRERAAPVVQLKCYDVRPGRTLTATYDASRGLVEGVIDGHTFVMVPFAHAGCTVTFSDGLEAVGWVLVP